MMNQSGKKEKETRNKEKKKRKKYVPCFTVLNCIEICLCKLLYNWQTRVDECG